MALRPELPQTLPEAHALILALLARIARLEQRVEDLEARLNQSSQNSSRPPSSDPPNVKRPPPAEPSGRKPGGQPGHKGRTRELLPPEKVDDIQDHFPEACERCGTSLRQRDAVDPPLRHQVTEIPKVTGFVVEHRLHALMCKGCNHATRADLPADVPNGAFGPRLQAVVALFSGAYRLGKRTVAAALGDLYGIDISVGSVSASEQLMSEALAAPVAEAHAYVQKQPVVHGDETGWRENRKRAWLWVAASTAVTVFLVHAKRGAEAARELLGQFAGILVTDRWNAYGQWALERRQLCWAHLKRDFQFMSERGKSAGRIGAELVNLTKQMFRVWHRVRDGTLTRPVFRRRIEPIRERMEMLLKNGAACHDRKVSGMCLKMLKVYPAFWTFTRIEGVEPTNNHAERSIRPAVLWRKNSFGTHSAAGSRFVERMMTVVVTLRQQGKNVLDYLSVASKAPLQGTQAPSLLPGAHHVV